MALPDRQDKGDDMQFQVPQNIDLEDKIIGPLTLKQFIYLLVGGMLDYMWYTFFDSALFIILSLPTTVFALAMAFAKVQDQPFPKFLGSLIIFILRPKILTWGKTQKPKIIESPDTKKEKIIHPKMAEESQIQKLSQIIDTQGWSNQAAKKAEQKPETPLQKKESFIEKVMRVGNQPIGRKSAGGMPPASPNKPEVIRPQISQPQAKNWHPSINAKIVPPEQLEQELGLSNRVKTHEAIKPTMNMGPDSENTTVDILENPKQQSGGKK